MNQESTDNFTIELVGPTDAKALSQLAQQCYFDHFPYLWKDNGKGYAEATFAEKALQLELTDPESRTYWAQYRGQPVGYMKINLRAPLDNLTNALELQRIYLLSRATGRGIGQALVKQCFETARQQKREIIWLKVMTSSRDSIAFYQKLGFYQHTTTYLTYPNLKPEYQEMWVMKKVISTSNRMTVS